MSQNRKPRGIYATENGHLKLQEAKAAGRDEDGKPLTFEKIALKAGVNERTVRRLFNQEDGVDRDSGFAICKALGLEPTEILELDPPLEEPDRTGQKRINPFIYGKPVSPEQFYGRRRAILDVRNRIGAISAECINIVGFRRSGKSSLLRYIKERPEEFCLPQQKPLIVLLDLQDARYHTPEGINEGLRQGINRLLGREPWLETENTDPYAVEDGLMAVRDQDYRLVVVLDELERVGKRLEEFQDWGEDWRSKACADYFALVIASKRPLHDIYVELNLTSPFGNIFSTTVLGALEEEAWHRLVKDGLGDDLVTAKMLQWIDELSGGLPYFVQLAAAMLWQHETIEAAELEFVFQATPRFQELWKNLTTQEQTTLKFAAGISKTEPESALVSHLQRYGLLRQPSIQLFSRALAEVIQGL